MSGYELRGLIQRSIGYFWNESFGQIYPALHALAEEGLIEREKPPKGAESGRERQVYAITPAGRQALKSWLPLPPRVQTPRNELLLKLFFGRNAPAGVSTAHVEALHQKAQRNLETFRHIERQLREEEQGHPDLPFWLMTLRHGELMAEAELRWSEETMQSLLAQARVQPAKHANKRERMKEQKHAAR